MTERQHGVPAERCPAKFVLLQTAVGDYRQEVLEVVKARLGNAFVVLAGSEYFDGTTKTRINLGENLRIITNVFIRRKLSFQLGCWRETVGAEAAILELNPRILSVWVMIAIRRLLNKRTAMWGHASSRAGPGKGGTFLRDSMCMLAGRVVAYTNTEARRFQERMPELEIVAAPNSLYSRSRIRPATSEAPPTDILFAGRLVRDKKPMLLLDAFALAAEKLPAEAKLVYVGLGPEKERLMERASLLGFASRVRFKGHVAAYGELVDVYRECLVSTSPGYVGLSLIQSLSFGVPMLIADDEPHSPEIEAARDRINSLFFRSNDPVALAEKLRQVFAARDMWTESRASIAEDCRQHYSVEVMAEGLLRAFGV